MHPAVHVHEAPSTLLPRHQHFSAFYCCSAFNRVPKCHSIGKAPQVQSCVDSGLNCIIQLVEIMQLGAKPQLVGDVPLLLSVAWLLYLRCGYCSCLDRRLQGTHGGLGCKTRMGGHVWHCMTHYYVKVPVNAIFGMLLKVHVVNVSHVWILMSIQLTTSCMLPRRLCRLDKLLV